MIPEYGLSKERSSEMPRVVSARQAEEYVFRDKVGRKILASLRKDSGGEYTIDDINYAMCYGPILAYRYESSEQEGLYMLLPLMAVTTDEDYGVGNVRGISRTYHRAFSDTWNRIYDNTVGRFIVEHLSFFRAFNKITMSKYGFDVFSLLEVEGLNTPLVVLNVLDEDSLKERGTTKPIWKLGAFVLRLITEYDNSYVYDLKDVDHKLFQLQGMPDLPYEDWLANILFTGGVASTFNSYFKFTLNHVIDEAKSTQDIFSFFENIPTDYSEVLDKMLFTPSGAFLLYNNLDYIKDSSYGNGYAVMTTVVANTIKALHNHMVFSKKG